MTTRSLRMSLRIPAVLTAMIIGVVSCESACGQALTGPVRQHYQKREERILMRDGVRLHTTIYTPRDHSRNYPFLLMRTPYGCQPYGANRYPTRIAPPLLQQEGYIIVHQDVRGRWMSEGTFDNMRPHTPGDARIDESSDTWDTIDWLLEYVAPHNGRVGMIGISYPGFYAAAALAESHPALVAVSPQAPIADFYFDDFHHQGAYTLMYWAATPVFGHQTSRPVSRGWYPDVQPVIQDAWQFYLDLTPLSRSSEYFDESNFFWRQLVEHPNYDDFWQSRNLLPHLTDVRSGVMTVGGWFDAEDLYGPLNIYRQIESHNPEAFNILVMGPWSHGAWARDAPVTQVGNIVFGEDISSWYQREVEAPFFRHFLHEDGPPPDFEALVFDTGRKQWQTFGTWPPAEAATQAWYLGAEQRLHTAAPEAQRGWSEFVSDPADPVPYRRREDIRVRFTPGPYMTDDQRFASDRPDVLVYATEPLEADLTLAGPLTAHLFVESDQTDADWVVKLIDVYPADTPQDAQTPPGIQLAGYQQMVRSEVVRSRYRESFERPKPLTPHVVTAVDVPLQDVFHTFRRGHRVMVHVQSSWFPLIDRNPQTWVENIFRAPPESFVPATHRVHHSAAHPSGLTASVLPTSLTP